MRSGGDPRARRQVTRDQSLRPQPRARLGAAHLRPQGLPAPARPKASRLRATQEQPAAPPPVRQAHLQRAPAVRHEGRAAASPSWPGRPRASPAIAALRSFQSEVHARGPREGQQHFGNVELGRRGGGTRDQQHGEREQQPQRPPGPRRHPRCASPPATRRPRAPPRALRPARAPASR